MRTIIYISILLITTTVWACKSSKKISSPDGEKLSQNKLEKRMSNVEAPAEWLSCRGQLNVDLPDMKASGSFRMHIHKDSAIWMQVSKLGLEVGRILITPDSILYINRWENTYIKDHTKNLISLIGSDVSFIELQRLLWGMPVIYNKDASVVSKGNYFLVSGQEQGGNSSFLYSVTAPFYIISGFLQKSNANGTMQTLEFTNDDFQAITNDYYFPYIRDYELTTPQTKMKIEMSVQNLKINEAQDLHIRIPSHYEPLLD